MICPCVLFQTVLSSTNRIIASMGTYTHHWDLQSGGTWMGVTPQGRWELISVMDVINNNTRLLVVSGFFRVWVITDSFCSAIRQQNFAGFNLFMGTADQAGVTAEKHLKY